MAIGSQPSKRHEVQVIWYEETELKLLLFLLADKQK